MPSPSPESVVAKVLELMGGRDKAFLKFDEDYAMLTRAWAQDTERVGRILRGHLFVEHLLTKYLEARGPDLNIAGTQLSFAKKISLLGEGTAGVRYLIPGIKRLNVVRNRVAHTLRAEVTQDDANVFLGIGLFRAMREESARRRGVATSPDPLDVIDDFAKHTGIALHASATQSQDVWVRAYELAAEELGGESDAMAT